LPTYAPCSSSAPTARSSSGRAAAGCQGDRQADRAARRRAATSRPSPSQSPPDAGAGASRHPQPPEAPGLPPPPPLPPAPLLVVLLPLLVVVPLVVSPPPVLLLLVVVPEPPVPLLVVVVVPEPPVPLLLVVPASGTHTPAMHAPPGHAMPSGNTGLEQAPVAGAQTPAPWQASAGGGHMTGFVPVHTPAMQVSVCVQRSLSLQAWPSGAAGFEHMPVVGLQVPAVWHWSSGMHTTGAPAVQTPLWQASPIVQLVPALHAVPFAFGTLEQVPFAGLHVLGWWHWSAMGQTTGLVPVQTPAMQTSVCVQRLLSLQVVPSGSAGFEQPEAGLQTPALWHWSMGPHVMVTPSVQTPAWQVSPLVQALPSLQAVPFGFGTLEQMPVAGLHVLGWWHWSAAGQVTEVPAVHTPETHTSFMSQALPSLQDVPSVFVGLEQPEAGLQTPAVWHWSSAVQVTAFPPLQAPA
jgi:hypothetical protein